MNVYLDYAAATPVDPRVIKEMIPYFNEKFFNPSAAYLASVEVKNDYLAAKEKIARFLGTKADNLVMTAGATESINLAFNGRKNVIISGIEHPAVIKVAKTKQKCQITKVKPDGIIDLEDLQNKINDQVDFLAVSLVSSDLGTIQPISKISQIVKQVNQGRLVRGVQTKLVFYVDASQGFGAIKINLGRLGADLVTISGAKIYGPKQVAALWVNPGVEVKPLILGGGQEMGLRSGTENVPFVIGMAKAIELITKINYDQISKMRNQLEKYLIEKIKDIKIVGNPKKRLPNYLVFSVPGIEAERLIYRLEEFGISVSTGAACAANKGHDSQSLINIGLNESERKGSLRVTLGKTTTADQIEYVKKIIVQEILAEKERINAR